jgi:DNA repair protein Rad10
MAEDDFDDDDFDEIVNQIDEVEKKKKTPSISWFNIQVSPEQALNPVLQRITKVPYQVSDIPTDFQTSHDVGILWLSLKYYNYRRTYIEERVEKLKDTSLKLIVVLLYVDNPNAEDAARTLSVLSCRLNFTLLVAFNLQEAASHIENFKRFANKGPETLKGKFDETDRVTKLLTIASGLCLTVRAFFAKLVLSRRLPRRTKLRSPAFLALARKKLRRCWSSSIRHSRNFSVTNRIKKLCMLLKLF